MAGEEAPAAEAPRAVTEEEAPAEAPAPEEAALPDRTATPEEAAMPEEEATQGEPAEPVPAGAAALPEGAELPMSVMSTRTTSWRRWGRSSLRGIACGSVALVSA